MLIDEQRGSGLSIGAELSRGFALIEGHPLSVDVFEESEASFEAVQGESFRQREEGCLELTFGGIVRSLLMVETEFGIGTVGAVIERGGFDEPGISSGPHDPGELSGNDSSGRVDQFFGEDDGRGEVIEGYGRISSQGGDAGEVFRARGEGIESGRDLAASGEHDVMAGRMVVGRMGQGADDRPQVASLGEHRKMLANVETWGVGGDGRELSPNVDRGIRLGVEAFVL